MPDHLKLGQQGEELAIQYLQEQGYQLLERNWRHKRLEVDCIAAIADELVFVEVKTRSTAYFGSPAEAVTRSKQQNLFDAAEAYLEQNEGEWECRFDVIAVIITEKGTSLDHLPDAFGPAF